MKICHIINSFPVGGIENLIVDIANKQCRNHNVSIVILNDYIDINLINRLKKEVDVIKIKRPLGSINPFYILKLTFRTLKEDADIYHFHSDGMINYCFLLQKDKCVLTIHDTFITLTKPNRFSRFISISKSVQNKFKKQYNLDSSKIYNGIDTSQFKVRNPDELKSTFRIVQISRLEKEKKGQHILIQAIEILVNRLGINNIRVDFIGDGSSLKELQKLVCDQNLNPYINFLGAKDRAYLFENLCQYDLLVQPSIYEGFGLTVAEAMAAKVPVLTSDIEGPMEIINNGQYGYYFKSQDFEDCANKISGIIQNQEDVLAKTETAYSFVRNKFDIEKCCTQYIKEYQNLNQQKHSLT